MKKALIAIGVAAAIGLSGCGAKEATVADSTESVSQAVAAIKLAETQANGRAFELDSEDLSRWEINVASNEREIEVRANRAGTEVTRTRDDGPIDATDRDQLADATVPMVDAVSTAGESAQGTVSSAELTTHQNALVWSVEFDSGSKDTEVFVDAATGKVLHVVKN